MQPRSTRTFPALAVGTVALVLVNLALTMTAAGAEKEVVSSAPRTFVEGPGLQGGQQHHEGVFTIHAVGPDGVPTTTGGEPFVVTIDVPEPTTPKVKDNHDGTYSVTYMPEHSGDYVIGITLNGDHVRDSPFTVLIKRAPSPERSFADGPGLSTAVAGEVATFTIHALDEAGNSRNDGGDVFPTTINGPTGHIPTDTTDNDDGTYTIRYTPPAAGNYTIKVEYEGKTLFGSPYHVVVTA